MFEHSVKVPRHYKIAANIFKKVSTEGGSVKTLLYDDKLRHFRTNVLYALITETIKHAADIDKIFEHCKLLETESRLDPWLAKVLTAELLFGKQSLPSKSKPELTILSYKEKFEKYASDHQDELKNEVSPRPRYIRINTNLFTTSDAIGTFQEEGYKFIRCTSGPYEDYLEQIQRLTEYEFTQDYHVKTIFVFSPGTKWHDHDLYLENKIILQDKATALAVHLLAPPAGSVALDMCAAPGMKTTQLAAYMRNDGKVYAVERNEKRYQTLCDFVQKTGCKCVQTFHKDALDIKRGEFEDAEYILLDPSCSGSGMDFCVHNYIEDTRLAKLTSLQEKFLKHAMNSFPKAKRIVYSTCSIFPEENERVITNVVKTSRAKWRVQDVKDLLKGQWKNFGSGMYGSMGARCLYAKPDSDMTTGFFLAVLDRDVKDLAKAYRQEEKDARDVQKAEKSKKQSSDIEHDKTLNENEDANEMEVEELPDRKKKKKDKKKKALEDFDVNVNGNEKSQKMDTQQIEDEDQEEVPKKKKKKKDRHLDNTEINAQETIEESEKISKKKKRKIKDSEQNSQSSLSNVIENLEDLNVEELEIPKKKKKKDKNNDSEISHNVIEIVDDGEFSNEVKKKSKKKKKDKMEV